MRQSQLLLIVCIYLIAASIAFATASFPTTPDTELTPGALCKDPDTIRYPEKIPYCDRDVNAKEKWAVILRYTKKLHFVLNDSNRSEFKIDHYIPLCMGGANSLENLWPQHQTVYRVTDELEEVLCEVLAEGKMKQSQAVEKIKSGKNNLTAVPEMILHLKSMLK